MISPSWPGRFAVAILLCLSAHARAQTPDIKSNATGSISGQVTVAGKPAAGISVAAFSIDSPNRRLAVARAVTDSEGKYRLSGLAPSQYQIATLAPNLTPSERTQPSFMLVYVGASRTIILAAGETIDAVDIKLVRGSVITGKITDADGKPVVEEHVSLQLVDENGNPSRAALPPITNGQMYSTDDRGIYRIYGLPAGRYKVSVGNEPGGGLASNTRAGYYLLTFYPGATDAAKADIVDLAEGGEATSIDIQLGRRAETYNVSGRVVDSDTGQPIAGTRVFLQIQPQESGRNSPSFDGQPTSARGEFSIDGLSPGRYEVFISSQFDNGDAYSDPVTFEIVDSNVSGLEVKAIRGLSISGTVVADTDIPKELLAQIKDLRVYAYVLPTSNTLQISNSATSLVAADGSFQVRGLRPGRVSWSLSAAPPRRPSIRRFERDGAILNVLELQPGQSVSGIRIVFTYGTGVLRGSVRIEGGPLPPESHILVRCVLQGTHERANTQLDSRGHFVFNGLSPGTYDVAVMVNLPGRPMPQKQVVTVTNDTESQVDFVIDLSQKGAGP